MRLAASAWIVPVLAAGVACGGGGGGGGVIDTTAASQGAITAIGSAAATGTVWDVDDASVVFDDDVPGLPAQLAPGMVAAFQGRRADASNATAQFVVVNDAIEGPIDGVTDIDSDRAELEILGQTVIAEDGLTFFGGDPGYDFGMMAPDDLVEVWGYLDGDGVIHATRIEKDGTYGGGNPDVAITGPIENLDTSDPDGGSFELGGITVTYLDADLIGVPGEEQGLSGDKLVGVKGSFDAGQNEITSSEIHIRGPFTFDISDLVIEGIVSGLSNPGDTTFRVAAQPVEVRILAEYEPANFDQFIDNGMRVQVEGSLSGGTFAVSSVRFRDPEVWVAAQIAEGTDVDDVNRTVTLLGGVVVQVDDATYLEDEIDPPPLTVPALMAGNYIEVRGVDLDGVVLANSLIRRAVVGDIKLRGRVESFDNTPSVLAIAGSDDVFFVDGTTTFSEFPGAGVANESDLLNFMIANPATLLEVTDDTGTAEAIDVANEIEYEDES
jgi:hypothetical protein